MSNSTLNKSLARVTFENKVLKKNNCLDVYLRQETKKKKKKSKGDSLKYGYTSMVGYWRNKMSMWRIQIELYRLKYNDQNKDENNT